MNSPASFVYLLVIFNQKSFSTAYFLLCHLQSGRFAQLSALPLPPLIRLRVHSGTRSQHTDHSNMISPKTDMQPDNRVIAAHLTLDTIRSQPKFPPAYHDPHWCGKLLGFAGQHEMDVTHLRIYPSLLELLSQSNYRVIRGQCLLVVTYVHECKCTVSRSIGTAMFRVWRARCLRSLRHFKTTLAS